MGYLEAVGFSVWSFILSASHVIGVVAGILALVAIGALSYGIGVMFIITFGLL